MKCLASTTTLAIISIALLADANNFTTEPTERQDPKFEHITITALVVVSIASVVLAAFTIMACYMDFGNVKHGLGELAVIEDFEEEIRSTGRETRDRITSSESERRKLVRDESEQHDTVGAVKPTDLAADATQISKLAAAPPRLDAQAKQARIIEAIYQASGREVPLMYRSEKKSGDNIVIPREVHQTLEGIADRDLRSEGSPVVSPSRLRYPTQPPANREDSQTDVSATMHTTGLSNLPTTDQAQPSDRKATTPISAAKSPLPTAAVSTATKPLSKPSQLVRSIHPDDASHIDRRSRTTSLVTSQMETMKTGPTSLVKRSMKASSKEPVITTKASHKMLKAQPASKSGSHSTEPKR